MKTGLWGFGDQALVSAANFITMALVARGLTPQEFGIFTLAYTGLMFMISIQSALVLQPYTMLGATKSDAQAIRYSSDTMWSQVVLSLVTAIGVVLLAAPLHAMNTWVAPVVLSLAPAVFVCQLREYIRRIHYVQSGPQDAFTNDAVTYGGQIVCIVALWRLHEVTPVTALLILSLTSMVGLCFGLWQARHYLDWRLDRESIRGHLQENWNFGKWLLGGEIFSWTSIQIFPILAAAFISVAATGALRAIQTILGPLNIINISMEPLFGPQVAKQYASGGQEALHQFVKKLEILLLLTVGPYCIAIAVFGKPLLGYIYGPAYAEYAWLLVVVALVNLVGSMRAPALLAFEAIGKTRVRFQVNLASTCLNLSLGIALILIWGIHGLAIGMTLNSVAIFLMIGYFYKVLISDSRTNPVQQHLQTGMSSVLQKREA